MKHKGLRQGRGVSLAALISKGDSQGFLTPSVEPGRLPPLWSTVQPAPNPTPQSTLLMFPRRQGRQGSSVSKPRSSPGAGWGPQAETWKVWRCTMAFCPHPLPWRGTVLLLRDFHETLAVKIHVLTHRYLISEKTEQPASVNSTLPA